MCYIQECTSEVEVWHDSVRFYKIFNQSGNSFFCIFNLLFNTPVTQTMPLL